MAKVIILTYDFSYPVNHSPAPQSMVSLTPASTLQLAPLAPSGFSSLCPLPHPSSSVGGWKPGRSPRTSARSANSALLSVPPSTHGNGADLANGDQLGAHRDLRARVGTWQRVFPLNNSPSGGRKGRRGRCTWPSVI